MEQGMASDVPLTSTDDDVGWPFGIWKIIFDNGWLLGSLLAVMSATLQAVGLVLQKKAQYKLMGDNLSPTDPKPTRSQILGTRLFWTGLTFYLLYDPVNMLALKYAPETTVLPLSACNVVVAFLLSFVVLYERFTRTDILASVVCIFGAVAMSTAMSRSIPGHLEDFPIEEVLQMSNDLLTHAGFAAWAVSWLALCAMCLYITAFVPMQSLAKPFAVPLLIGLLKSLCHFMSKIMVTLVMRSKDPEVWGDPVTFKVITFTMVLGVLTTLAMCEGVQQLSCRFFVPAVFVACQVLITTQDLLFFRTWEAMTEKDIFFFVIASIVSIAAVAFISPEQRVVSSPLASGLNTPLLSPKADALRLHQNVLNIIDDYRIRKPSAPDSVTLKTIDMTVPVRNFWRAFPILISIGMVSLPMVLWYLNQIFLTLVLLTLFSTYQAWKMGMHIVLFSWVGTKKVEHFENADFQALYNAEKHDRKLKLRTEPKWEDVRHFVVLPNYKEDVEVLRLAIRSIASSGVARKQICLVLAMEAREAGSKEKAELLMNEFRNNFCLCEATYHPEGLPGEVPGKSANTRWATDKVLSEVMPAHGLNVLHTIFTVGDADSEFHPEYFAALTYYFVHAGGGPDKTPDRYLTIWQAPIVHYKNYITQPVVVRIASYLTSQHELANLSDPNAARVPYSTYSISARLAADVKGWDPDWISEDWHMCLKCFLATGGRLKVSPIFLPILNYAPEGDSWFQTLSARWTQAKRHALGFSELVYLQDHAPRVFRSIEGRRAKAVFLWRLCFLWFKLLMIHIFMACFPVILPMNSLILGYFAKHELKAALTINSWTFLANCVAQGFGFLAFMGFFASSVRVYETVKHRIDGSATVSILWKSPTLHFLTFVPQSLVFLPLFFVLASAAEWIAAVKTARTHVFEYAVALKPKLPAV